MSLPPRLYTSPFSALYEAGLCNRLLSFFLPRRPFVGLEFGVFLVCTFLALPRFPLLFCVFRPLLGRGVLFPLEVAAEAKRAAPLLVEDPAACGVELVSDGLVPFLNRPPLAFFFLGGMMISMSTFKLEVSTTR